MDIIAQIEDIKILKAKYFRFLDSKEWDSLGLCLAENINFKVPKQDLLLSGKQNVMDSFRNRHASTITAHTGSMPEIEIIDDFNATGIWFMTDVVIIDEDGKRNYKKGYGRYHEHYVKSDIGWQISNIELDRICYE